MHAELESLFGDRITFRGPGTDHQRGGDGPLENPEVEPMTVGDRSG